MMNKWFICCAFLIITILFAPVVLAKENPYKNAGKVTAQDIPVPVESDKVILTNTSEVKLNGADYNHTIGRVSITMKPLVQGLSKNSKIAGNSISVGDSPMVRYEFYQDLIKEQVILKSPETVKYSYDFSLSDWVTEEPDLSQPEITTDANNTKIVSYPRTKQVTNYAKDSTSDIVLDQWGNLVVTVNDEDVVVIPKPFATDATGRRFDLDFELNKGSRIITVTGNMTGAEYPVTVDPCERVTNGGFETGTTAGWSKTGNPILTIVSGGASGGNYYCLDRGNGIWSGTGGYNRIYQTIDYTGVTSVSMAVKFFQYNRYDYVFSDGFWTGPRNWVISFPGQQATSWVTKSATPSLTGQNLIQVWTYGGTIAGIDSISTAGTVTPPAPPGYSATLVGKYNPPELGPDAKAYLVWSQLKNLRGDLITPAFIHCTTDDPLFAARCDGQVTKPDFGTSGNGLNNALLHYHWGHGENGKINLGSDFLLPSEVSGKWNGKNKWVVIDACEVLSDRSWNYALGTSHGVMGFETVKPMDEKLAQFFIENLKNKETVYNSYKLATIHAYQNSKGYGDIRAVAIFKTQTQRDQDTLSNILQDEPSAVFVTKCWHVNTGRDC